MHFVHPILNPKVTAIKSLKISLRSMIDRSFDWATKNGLVRTNHQHGEQEARLILTDDFEVRDEQGESTQQEMAFTAEDT